MGKKNPIKQVIQASGDVLHNPIREAARAVGADGIVKGMDKLKDVHNKVGIGAVDLINDEKGKQQKKADAANAEASKQAAVAQAAETKRVNDANFAASEAERMSAGSASRTLLTGPAGLEDEDPTIARRVLQARR